MTTEPNDHSQHYKINVNDMYAASKGDAGNWGIEGYEVPAHYYDCLKSKKEKAVWEQISSNKLIPGVWPPFPKGEDGKTIFPQRPNFIDEVNKKI